MCFLVCLISVALYSLIEDPQRLHITGEFLFQYLAQEKVVISS